MAVDDLRHMFVLFNAMVVHRERFIISQMIVSVTSVVVICRLHTLIKNKVLVYSTELLICNIGIIKLYLAIVFDYRTSLINTHYLLFTH